MDSPPVAYWNDESIERKKPWWINDVHDTRLLEYLREKTNLERCFRDALSYIDHYLGGVRGLVIEPGSGTCWTSAILSRLPQVERVEAIDCSSIRLSKIAPIVFRQYEAVEDKINRRVDKFDRLPFPAESADLVLFCQAFYMTPDPMRLLSETRRVLKKNGIVAVVGENIVVAPSLLGMLRRRILRAASGASAADETGRHSYFDAQYRSFISEAGFRLHVQEADYPVYKTGPVPSINYFGVKP